MPNDNAGQFGLHSEIDATGAKLYHIEYMGKWKATWIPTPQGVFALKTANGKILCSSAHDMRPMQTRKLRLLRVRPSKPGWGMMCAHEDDLVHVTANLLHRKLL